MATNAKSPAWLVVDGFVDAFEEAQVREGHADLADFLPPPDHPDQREIVLELLRVDLEYRWLRGDPCAADRYRDRFPELFNDADAVRQLEFEVDRLQRRKIDGQCFPEVGDDLMGFHLVAELGRGAFATVYRAEQEGLANRAVALKVAKILFGESQTLAQLQHTNIVPIYSVHVQWPFQAVCMPYFGATTLADVLKSLRGNKNLPSSGIDLLSTVRNAMTAQRGTRSIGQVDVTSSSHENFAAATSSPRCTADGRKSRRKPISGSTDVSTRDSVELIEPPLPWTQLAGRSYVEAVLWMVARLADGLHHAHTRGVLHRDLKPANILLADDGQPMLLDFNLSVNLLADPSVQSVRVGGTLPYMSPEQIAALDRRAVNVDERSDIYSLGVVLYELLSLRQPFALPVNGRKESLAKLHDDRSVGPPPLAALNPAVTPAVESIVRHALEAAPLCRYSSAHELAEDIERHLAHRPLRYASEPSRRERAAKWVRRHPRLTSNLSVAILGVVSLLLVAGGWFLAERRHARLESVEQLRRFELKLPTLLFRLNGALSTDPPRQAELIDEAQRLLAMYHVVDDERWSRRPVVANLDDRLRHGLGEGLGGLCLSISAAKADAEANSEQLAEALAWNKLADRCFLPEERPRVLWTQRSKLLRQLGRVEEADAAAERAIAAPSQKAVDEYWQGFEHAQRHEYQHAIIALEAATEADPRFFWAWFQLGRCNDALLRNVQAAQCYTICLVLLPESGEAYYHRGLARLRDGLYAPALADFDQVLRLLPNLASVYVDRGEARIGLAQAKSAVDEFTHALELGADKPRALAGRAKALQLAGDERGAGRDLAASLAAQPRGADGWVARGMARLPADPAGALADYAEALKIAPRYLPALQNSAAVLGELPGRREEAILMLDRALDAYPDFVPALIGRAVLLARAGRRDAALSDVRQALARDQQPVTLYQAACAYALISAGHEEDRREALRLLSAALTQGFGQAHLGTDHDLDGLRGDEEFRRILTHASTPIGTKAE